MPLVLTSPPAESDRALARRIADGDLSAFETIMRRHNRMLYRIARSIVRDDAEAEDCLQSAYLLAYQSIATFAGHAKLSTWLARIVINEALGRRRRAARQGVVISLEHAAELEPVASAPRMVAVAVPEPETEAMRHELGSIIERRIDALPDAFRTVFVLRALAELAGEESGSGLDLPEPTVRRLLLRVSISMREA